MGLAWNTVCYQDPQSALNAFVRDAVLIDGTGITTFAAYPTITGTGQIAWSINHRPLSSSSTTTRNGTTQLPTCNTEAMSQWAQQDVVFYLAVVFAFFSGMQTGYRS